MIKKINKRILLRTSLLISGILAVFLNVGKEQGSRNPLIKALDIPIGSIEIAYASDAAGDCSGSTNCDSYSVPPTASGVDIQFHL